MMNQHKHIWLLKGLEIAKIAGGVIKYSPGLQYLAAAFAEELLARGDAEPYPRPEPKPEPQPEAQPEPQPAEE